MNFTLSKFNNIRKIIAWALNNQELFDRIVANSKAVIADVTEALKTLPDVFQGNPDDDKVITYGEGWALLEADPEFQVFGDGTVGRVFDGSRIKKLYDLLTQNPEIYAYLLKILATVVVL